MDTGGRDYYPPGHIRVSDAERDLAVSELSEALRAGRITVGEFDQRSAQILSARTGDELTAPLADLPVERAPAASDTLVQRPQRSPVSRFIFGSSVAAVCFAVIAALSPLSSMGPTPQQREAIEEMMARQGITIHIPPGAGIDWSSAIVPGAIAVFLVVLVIFLRVARARLASSEQG